MKITEFSPEDLQVGDMSVFQNDKNIDPLFNVFMTFKTRKEAVASQKRIISDYNIVNDIMEIISRKPQTEEDKTIIKVLAEIIENNN